MSERRHDSGILTIPEEHRPEARRQRRVGAVVGAGLGTVFGAMAALVPTKGSEVLDYALGKPAPYTLAECIRDKEKDVKEAWEKAGNAIRRCQDRLDACRERR